MVILPPGLLLRLAPWLPLMRRIKWDASDAQVCEDGSRNFMNDLCVLEISVSYCCNKGELPDLSSPRSFDVVPD